jgi:hypothetical protein
MVLRLGSSALVSVVEVRSLVVVVLVVCVSVVQLAKPRARTAITLLAISFMSSVYSIDSPEGKPSPSHSPPAYFSGSGCAPVSCCQKIFTIHQRSPSWNN